jgi:hypothetical protein
MGYDDENRKVWHKVGVLRDIRGKAWGKGRARWKSKSTVQMKDNIKVTKADKL